MKKSTIDYALKIAKLKIDNRRLNKRIGNKDMNNSMKLTSELINKFLKICNESQLVDIVLENMNIAKKDYKRWYNKGLKNHSEYGKGDEDLYVNFMVAISSFEENRTVEEIGEAANKYCDIAWYNTSKDRTKEEFESLSKETREKIIKAQSRMEKEIDKSELIPPDEFELGMVYGKLSALRWVLGNEWDFLDT